MACWNYWCAPCGCYFPVDYCPTGSYEYDEPDEPAAPDDPDAPDEPTYEDPNSIG
jgi:hypothetical protein